MSSRELASLVHRTLARRDMSVRDFDALCCERYHAIPVPPYPGQTRHDISRLEHTTRCPVSVADRLLVALGLSLQDLESYRSLPNPIAREDLLQLPGLPPCR